MHFLSFLLPVLVKAKVIEATDKDLGNYLHNGIPTIIDLYATWCGHCKTFSPVFDELAAKYEHLSDEIQFIKIDGDKNRKASTRFNVEYFPTIKFIDAEENVEEIDERNLAFLQKFIKEKTGIIPDGVPKKKKVDPNLPKISKEDHEFKMLVLRDDNFEEHIKGKNALVSFTTAWCTYCKAMAPEWEKLGRMYANDSEVVIANVDCSDLELSYSLTDIFGIEGFPSILYFEADKEMPSEYSGSRKAESFVKFLREKGITHRLEDGSLSPEAGTIPSLDLSVLPDYRRLLNQLSELKNGEETAEVYEHILKKAISSPEYIEKEAKRLEKLLEEKDMYSKAEFKKFQIKLNILKSLIEGSKDVKDEV